MNIARLCKRLIWLAVLLTAILFVCSAALAKPYKISTTQKAYESDEPIIVTFSGAPGYWRDWICIVPKGAPHDEAGEYEYTGSGVHEGAIRFAGKPPGDYEARAYFDFGNLGYVISARALFKVVPRETSVDDSVSQSPPETGLTDETRVPRSQALAYFLKTLVFQFMSPNSDQELYDSLMQNYELRMKDYHLGEVVGLDAERFDAFNGHKGLWDPIQFLSDEGLGVFFLEPYNPDKTPILFIHGAGGYPQEWNYLIDALDKTKYQAWVFQYSSGMRLGWTAKALDAGLKTLRTEYKFEKIFIVAHSMGGLVARKFLDIYQGGYIKLLVTISTPWGGHNAAEIGVNYASEIVPSWHDMIPGSPFLSSLFEPSGKQQPPYFLFFGYKGKYGIFIDGNSDGTVSLESMLNPKAQKEASKVYGFNADHTGILIKPEVADTLNEIMKSN